MRTDLWLSMLFWCRKTCQIVYRVSRKWIESKFLDQDVDVVSLANKCKVIGCFSAGTITKFSWKRESSLTKSRSRKMDSDLVLTECLSRRILRFTTSAIDLIHSERVSNSTSSFLTHYNYLIIICYSWTEILWYGNGNRHFVINGSLKLTVPQDRK